MRNRLRRPATVRTGTYRDGVDAWIDL